MSDKMQRTDEWEVLDEGLLTYHLSQWEKQKRSTIFFEIFCKKKIAVSNRVLDVAGGSGGATYHFAKNNPSVAFVCTDYVEELIKCGINISRQKKVQNLEFEVQDWFNLPSQSNIDGVISMQTLSWLPEYERPLAQIIEKVSPDWMAFTSLFYEGDITAKTEICENQRGARKSFYNTYSVPELDRFCRKRGYRVSDVQDFDIDIDIPKPLNADLMGTYTINAEIPGGTNRLQVSGPLLMNWKMLMIEKQTV